MLRTHRLFWLVGLVYLVSWVAIAWLTSPALDPYGDMVENYAWSQTLAWGTFKHPPLVAWVVRLWFSVFPTQVWAYYVLAYANAGLGALGVVALAGLWLPTGISRRRRDAFLIAVLLFTILSFPFSNLALKFNTDTLLLSSWPWTAYAFFAAVQTKDARRRWLFAILLAGTAAAAMLGKYYSALLLASLLIISLSHPVYRRWYRTPSPYVALLVLALLLLPHVSWEAQMRFPFRDYLITKIDNAISASRIVAFLLSGVYYLPVSWLAWLTLRQRFTNGAEQPVAWPMPRRGLVLLCVLPTLLTVLFNLFFRIHLTTHWAIPDWFALPVLLGVWLLPRIGDDFDWRRLRRGLAVAWVVLLAGAIVYTVVLSATGNPKYALARQAMVRTIESRFAARFPGQQLSWAGGTWPESGAIAFFSSAHPRAVPGFPDQMPALANPFPDWRETFGVLICFASGDYAREGARDTDCEDRTRTWLRRHDRGSDEETIGYRAEGWRFLRPDAKNVTVFWVAPDRTKTMRTGG